MPPSPRRPVTRPRTDPRPGGGCRCPARAPPRGAGNCALSLPQGFAWGCPHSLRPPAGGPGRTELTLRLGDDPRAGGGLVAQFPAALKNVRRQAYGCPCTGGCRPPGGGSGAGGARGVRGEWGSADQDRRCQWGELRSVVSRPSGVDIPLVQRR
ncbi:hypothetical protein SBRY_70341 [Actinacidiphila bryophytorum]|uniref:Uncharacterized protein n=1 Tax=Actinacidiphila bryophytorum TaxID=1436133 RepID=A0A9W4H7K2_9ACTN|nr:hypothetical protein SBRY_70341 [Actinacidiphila bryophytorum]